MSSLLASLPGPGLLPSWMLFISALSIFNTAQVYTSTKLSKRVYAGKPHEVTPLSARTFGTWTILAALVRTYAAFNINSRELYNLAFGSYIIAFVHFTSELLIYRTAVLGKGFAGPAIVSTCTLLWMTLQRGFYLGA